MGGELGVSRAAALIRGVSGARDCGSLLSVTRGASGVSTCQLQRLSGMVGRSGATVGIALHQVQALPWVQDGVSGG